MEGPAAPWVASAVFLTTSPVRLSNKMGLTMSASPCIKASGFAGFALGCFLFSSVLTSGVSSSSPPLPYSVMREMAEWTSPFRMRVANRLFSFLSVIPRCQRRFLSMSNLNRTA